MDEDELDAEAEEEDQDELEFEDDQEDESAPEASEEAAGEAPELADMVEAGDLPPLEERLPDEPFVVEPVNEVGTYGGTWNKTAVGPGDILAWEDDIFYEQLLQWSDPPSGNTEPNVLKEMNPSDDGTEFEFVLREGLKWSDGEPFTSEDIRFAYEDVMLHDDITPGPPSVLMNEDGSPADVDVVDDYTIVFSYDEPKGLMAMYLADYNVGLWFSLFPRHYLEEFHIDHNPDADELAEEEGADDWAHLFELRGSGVPGTPYDARWGNPDLPTLYPWVVSEPIEEGQANRMLFERNPYYWKVDTEGNQLPYIDAVEIDIVDDEEVVIVQAMSGDIDFQFRHLDLPEDRSALADEREQGGYELWEYESNTPVRVNLLFNHTHDDDTTREILTNRDLRVGLSHAIDREEIIELLFFGMTEPHQDAPPEESPYYDEEMATQYTEYDVDLANQYLDDAGFDETDADGWRLGPDGEPIILTADVQAEQLERVDALELIQGYWEEVGVRMDINAIEQTLKVTREENNEHQITVHGSASDPLELDPYSHVPVRYPASRFGIRWAQWYQGSDEGVEPPEGPRRQIELYEELSRTADEDEQFELMTEILSIAKEEFYNIGIDRRIGGVGVVSNDFHNTKDTYIHGGVFNCCATSVESAQYYMTDDS